MKDSGNICNDFAGLGVRHYGCPTCGGVGWVDDPNDASGAPASGSHAPDLDALTKAEVAEIREGWTAWWDAYEHESEDGRGCGCVNCESAKQVDALAASHEALRSRIEELEGALRHIWPSFELHEAEYHIIRRVLEDSE